MRLILSGALLALGSIPAQDDPLAPRELDYVSLLGEGEIAWEKVTLTETGWSTEGRYDILGTRKGSFRMAMTRKPGGFRCDVVFVKDGEEKPLEAILENDSFLVQVPGTHRNRSSRVEGGDVVFVLDNMVWAGLIDFGRLIAERDAAGNLPEGAEFTAVSVAAGVGFNVEHLETTAVAQLIHGQQTTMRITRIKAPPGVEIVMVCTPSGLPLRIEVPAQQFSVVARGFEEVTGLRGKPTSIVDTGPWREKLSAPEHEVVIEKNVRVAMGDEIPLATDVYRPKGAGKFPTILARTPYGRASEGVLKGNYYAKRGFAFVAQDVRGRGDSDGTWFPFIHEEVDGSDTIDWIADQMWSDGKVGMIGASYVGLTQWLAAKSGNAHLRCIVPQVSPPDPDQNFPYEGGCFILGAVWWAKVLDSLKHGTSWQDLDWAKVYTTLPHGDFDDALGLQDETFLDTWLAHPPTDREFWDHARYQSRFGQMDLPAFHVTGWYDGDMPGAIMNFPGMRAGARTEAARSSQYLVIGPWTHFFNSARRIGDVDFGDEAVVDLDSRILRFFDRYLKNIDNGIDAEPPVHVFTMGSNRWHAETDWPLPQTEFTELYLASGGNAAQRDGDGTLGRAMAGGDADRQTYRYDPNDLPELDVDFTDLSGAAATRDWSDEPDRQDELEYTSSPLSKPCELVGPARAVLYVSTDAADTDFVVTLYRITAAGKRLLMLTGVQRLRYAKGVDAPVTPGTVVRIEVDLWATGRRLEQGDRLQAVVSSWAWPGYARNLNTLDSPFEAANAVVANNTIHHSAGYPSHLLLPVVPRDDAPGLEFERQ